MSSGGPPPIVQLTGPLLLGHLFNWGLYGCLALQCYLYYMSFPNDRLLPKTLVYTALILETLQTVLSTRDAFRNFGSGWGDLDDLNKVGWLWFSVPFLGSLITSLSQIFFAWRIWILGDNLYLPTLIVALSTLQCIFGCWVGIRAHNVGLFSEVQAHSNTQTSVWLGGTALCDFIISTSMIFYLSRSRTGFRSTNVLISKIIRITVETGFICAAFAILDLSFFLRWQDNNYHLAPSIALSKLYSNSLLVVLNARIHIMGGRDLSTSIVSDTGRSFTTSNTAVRRTAVSTLTIKSQQVDEEIAMTNTRHKMEMEQDEHSSQKAGVLV